MSVNPQITDAVTRAAITGCNHEKIFNFNIFKCYHLEENFIFWDKLSDDVELIFANKQVSFCYTTRLKRSGIILRLATIPSEVYHLFLTGQVVNGNQVSMRVRNRNPEFFLSPELIFKIGFEETKPVCFRALSHQTDIIILTDLHCFADLGPFVFTIKGLDIIPDCLMLPGYFEGPQGITGAQGPAGVKGKNAITFQGPQGITGPTGKSGSAGKQGSLGSQGSLGPIGPVGPFGFQGGIQGPTGPQGSTGNQGFIGSIGKLGTPGFIGDEGNQGNQGHIGHKGVLGPVGGKGPQGFDGFQGDTGPLGYRIGDNVFTDSFFMFWSRGNGNPASAVTTAYYQLTDNLVTLHIDGFICGSVGTGGPLVSDDLPIILQTPLAGIVYSHAIIYVNGAPLSRAIKMGPNNINIYKNLSLLGFAAVGEDVEVPSITLNWITVNLTPAP